MASKEVAQYSMLQFCQLQNAYFSVQKLIYFLSFTANIIISLLLHIITFQGSQKKTVCMR